MIQSRYCRIAATGIAAALLVVRDVEQQMHVRRIGRVEDRGDLLGLLACAVHVMVVDERNADVVGALAKLGEELSHPLIVSRRYGAPFRSFVDHLKELAARRSDESRVVDVQRELIPLDGGIANQIAAREDGEREMMLAEQIAQRFRPVAERRHRRRAKLDALVTDRRDVLDSLHVFAAPGDRRVPNRYAGLRSQSQRGAGGAHCGKEVPARHVRHGCRF